jgi:hypothetical protein
MTGSIKLGLLILVAALFPFRPESAHSAQPTAADSKGVDTVTIEAQREKALKREVDTYVSSLLVTYMNDSLERWDEPICPLVANLPKEQGEFILARISRIAKDANAPLASDPCKPNFLVIVTDQPDLLIRKWVKKDPGMIDTCNGTDYFRDFLHSRQPVRVYYNGKFVSIGGLSGQPAALDLVGLSLDFRFTNPCIRGGVAGSHLRYGAVQEISSAIIVVDSTRTTGLNVAQLADYVGMVGLAQIRVDRDTGTAPTILRVFGESDPLPEGLSPWDQSFLHSLYTTKQESVLQVSLIKSRMVQQMSAR